MASGSDRRVLLQGKETWFYPDGTKQHETEYRLGTKVGLETQCSATGTKQRVWLHHDYSTSDWTTHWSDGSKRSESTWINHELVPGADKFFEQASEKIVASGAP